MAGSGYPAPNPQFTPHLLPPKLKPHKDDPDNCFCSMRLGLLWGVGGRVTWVRTLLAQQDSLGPKDSQVGCSSWPKQRPHSGELGLAGSPRERTGP